MSKDEHGIFELVALILIEFTNFVFFEENAVYIPTCAVYTGWSI